MLKNITGTVIFNVQQWTRPTNSMALKNVFWMLFLSQFPGRESISILVNGVSIFHPHQIAYLSPSCPCSAMYNKSANIYYYILFKALSKVPWKCLSQLTWIFSSQSTLYILNLSGVGITPQGIKIVSWEVKKTIRVFIYKTQICITIHNET